MCRWLARGIIALIALGLAGAAYQAIASAIDRRRYPPPGRLVDVGGHRLHIHCLGEGSPTVVIGTTGAGAPLDWSMVVPELATFTRVCVYDRPGSGWSEPGPTPRTSQRIADEMHALLSNAGIAGPYVLVGHSITGMHMRLYASQHREDVAGMVLVDSSHEEQLEHLPAENRAGLEAQVRVLRVASVLAPFGVVRLVGMLGLIRAFDEFELLPQETQSEARAISYWSDVRMLHSELASAEQSTAQLRAAPRSLDDIPLAVLTAGSEENPPYRRGSVKEIWFDLQRDLATLSSTSRHIIAEKSGHYIHEYEPQLVVDAIRWVVEEARRA